MLEKEWVGVELVKKGKLFVSHRYNLIPLLHSCPGGVLRELVVQDLPLVRKINIIYLTAKFFLVCIFYICKKNILMDTRKFSMNYGAYLGLGLVLISFTVYMLGLEEQKSIIPSLLNNFLIIGAIAYSVTMYRDNFNNGFVSYSQSLKIGTSVVFFASVILAFYTYIFVTFINPEYLQNIIKIAEQEILNSDPEISDEDLDLALSMTQKMLQPQWMSTLSVLGGTFMGFFYSLIISFFVKKDDPNFIV